MHNIKTADSEAPAVASLTEIWLQEIGLTEYVNFKVMLICLTQCEGCDSNNEADPNIWDSVSKGSFINVCADLRQSPAAHHCHAALTSTTTDHNRRAGIC